MQSKKPVWLWLAAVALAGAVSSSVLSAEFPRSAVLPTKDEVLADVLYQFEAEYSIDPKMVGKILTVVIKDFFLEDEETYAIVEEKKDFWIITLPVRWHQLHGYYGAYVGRSHKTNLVRKELVSMTREQGTVFYFTVQPPRVR
jgi:hypothetical protein